MSSPGDKATIWGIPCGMFIFLFLHLWAFVGFFFFNAREESNPEHLPSALASFLSGHGKVFHPHFDPSFLSAILGVQICGKEKWIVSEEGIPAKGSP